MHKAKEQRKIPALTSLRFFAAFHVVLYHTAAFSFPVMFAIPMMRQFVSIGNIAVGFFFLLSGFILSYVYLQDRQTIDIKKFYWSRFSRIYPLYLLTLILDTPFLFLARVSSYGLGSAVMKTSATFLSNLLMIQVWFGRLRGIDNPNWSLCVEAVFYLTFPLVGIFLWRLRARMLYICSFLLWIFVLIILIHQDPHSPATEMVFKYPIYQMPLFLAGICVARIQLQSRSVGVIRSTGIRIALIAATLGMIIAIPFLLKFLPVEDLLILLLLPLYAVVILIFSSAKYPLTSILNSSWMVLLGEASYGLYLFHIPVFHLWIALHWDRTQALYPVYLAVCILVSLFSFKYFETPMRLWLMNKFRSNTAS